MEITVYHASAAVRACQEAGVTAVGRVSIATKLSIEAGRWQAALAVLSAAPALAVRPNAWKLRLVNEVQ